MLPVSLRTEALTSLLPEYRNNFEGHGVVLIEYWMQNLKIDKNQDGEAVLSAGRFVPWLTDSEGRSFKTGSLIWSEHRFRDIPGLMGHTEYEQMCVKLNKTSKWELARPTPKFQPGFAAYTLCRSPPCSEVRPDPCGPLCKHSVCVLFTTGLRCLC